MEKEYIVGIDFGHGETAAWVVPLDLTIGAKKGEALQLQISTTESRRSYDSVIYFTPQEGYSLINNKFGNIIAYFKNKISILSQPQNTSKREAYTEYIKQIYKILLERNTKLKVNKDDKSDTNFYLCIACPTKWDQEDKEAYIHFFNEALHEFGIEVMWVINESDAAYFTHGSIKKYKDKCVLVIDYGSSTIDYTVFYQGKKISEDNWSNSWGASYIEELIFNKYRDSDNYQKTVNNTKSKLSEIGDSFIDINSCIKYYIRKAKEDSVTKDNYPSLDFSFNLIGKQTSYGLTNTFKAADEKIKYKFEFDCQIDRLIEGYQTKVVDDFKQLKEKIRGKIGDQQIDYVILSGGASLMPWVSNAVNDIFKPLEIDLDTQASFVVAKGIALYARTQMKALDDFLSKIRSIDFSNTYIQADINATAKAILTMMPSMVEKLKKQSSLTGTKIRKEFCDFVKNLDGQNSEYCNLVQQELDSLISNSVADALKDVICDIFKTQVNTSDVKLHVEANIIPFDSSLFVKGGSLYDAFTNWIANSSNAIFGTALFKWENIRKEPEVSKMIEGTASTLENLVNAGPLADYSQALEFINAYAENIKEQVLENAINIFYEKQLFKTTFQNI